MDTTPGASSSPLSAPSCLATRRLDARARRTGADVVITTDDLDWPVATAADPTGAGFATALSDYLDRTLTAEDETRLLAFFASAIEVDDFFTWILDQNALDEAARLTRLPRPTSAPAWSRLSVFDGGCDPDAGPRPTRPTLRLLDPA